MTLPEPRKIRIAIADDHKVFRKGLCSILSQMSEVELLYEAGDGEELLRYMEDQLPDVLLLDLEMPVMDGIVANRLIRERYPQVRVLIISMHDENEMILSLIAEGVQGYLLKNADPEEVEEAVRKVMCNKQHFNERVTAVMQRKLMEMHQPKVENEQLSTLTSREREVLDLVLLGHSNPDIARALSISLKTVESRKNVLMRKLGVKNNAGIMLFANRVGLLKGKPGE